ncbi:hypothetical protein [Halolamina litorea]|uniref:Uncharacterized protein n=1 Tax=Halolamina litorea TaxID=1515593 RepID=A0ABD6BQ96_9EURY|nr:hypothetical protein [Halolamina litorea]
MLVLHFGVVHEDDCPELSTTRDWVAIDDLPDGSLTDLDVQRCAVCGP